MDVPLIRIEQTPNPDALRLVAGAELLNGPPVEIAVGDRAASAPLPAALLAVEGIERILIGPDFVTAIRRSGAHSWDVLKPQLLSELAEFLFSGQRALPPHYRPEDRSSPEDGMVVAQIREVLERHVRPMLARDGGEATLMRFDAESGVAYVHMGGACGGCPSGRTTLKQGIEQAIKRYVPEVARVEAAAETASGSPDPKARFRAWVAARFGRS